MTGWRAVPLLLWLALAVVGCSSAEPADGSATTVPTTATSQATSSLVDGAAALAAGCANVIDVDVEDTGGTFRFDVTVRSADTGPEKYADAWEIRAPDGTVLGVRKLLHDHVNEQPFTRSLSDVAIPPSLTEVVVAARDSVVGFCGLEPAIPVPGR